MATGKEPQIFRIPRGGRISLRDMLIAWWPALLIIAAGFAVAWQFVKPAPPSKVVFASGAEDGAYYGFAKQYGEILARDDITLEVRPTSGSVENYNLLKDDESDVYIGFVQGGIGNADEAPDLLSLGSMYYEPVWVFYHADAPLDRLAQFKGRRIAIGPEGSGTRALALKLLHANGIATPRGPLAELTGEPAVKAFRQGRLDAVIFIASPGSAAVNQLLRNQRVRLLNFTRAEAYTRHFPHLHHVVLPRGAIDLKRDLPRQDVHLVATTANLVVSDALHPALVGLLAAAAVEVHSAPGLLQGKDEFPSLKDVDFPASPEAARVYKSGPPFLQRYLPFWAAIFVDRMIVLLVPLIALALPLVRVLPALYNWRIRSRIYRNYGELKFLEVDVTERPAPEKISGYMARLDRIEERVNQMRIPLAFHEQMYTLRGHIDLVRARIARLAGTQAA